MRHRRPAAAARHRAGPPEERSLTGSAPRFVGAFPRADHPLDPPLPEIAFVGRSNVGKSSLLNALVGTRIARISATPGKTRLMNVFQIDIGRREWGVVRDGAARTAAAHAQEPRPAAHSLYFLDLPGYGYARASQGERRAFHGLVTHVLERPRLAGVVWLLDVRHEPSAEDRSMQERLAAGGVRVLAAVTKGDKLPREQRRRRERALREELALDEDQCIVTSARTGEGITELRESIVGLIRGSP